MPTGARDPAWTVVVVSGELGNKEAVAGIKAKADQRAEGLRSILNVIRPQGITIVRKIKAELNRRHVPTAHGATWHPTDYSSFARSARLSTPKRP